MFGAKNAVRRSGLSGCKPLHLLQQIGQEHSLETAICKYLRHRDVFIVYTYKLIVRTAAVHAMLIIQSKLHDDASAYMLMGSPHQ